MPELRKTTVNDDELQDREQEKKVKAKNYVDEWRGAQQNDVQLVPNMCVGILTSFSKARLAHTASVAPAMLSHVTWCPQLPIELPY